MTETENMIQQKHSAEPWMNGAAIVLSDGSEIPITDSMVRQSLEAIAGPVEEPAPKSRCAS